MKNYLRLWLLVIITAAFTLVGCTKQKPADKKSVKTESEAAMFASASQAEQAGRFKQAVEIYENILEKYPDSPNADKAFFMLGFLKSENLKQKKEAMDYFNRLLEKYPDSELADDAAFMLKSIKSGKDALSAFEADSKR